MRQIYETKAQLALEDHVADICAVKWGVRVVKLKPLYSVDRATIDEGEVTGLLEIKCRSHTAETYKDYMISLDKVMSCLEFATLTGLTVVLVVHFTDKIMWHHINPRAARDYWYGMGGRTDRNDVQDQEPVCYIPMKLFKNL